MSLILLRGGTIADGTGAPLQRGDVLIDGERIAAVGTCPEPHGCFVHDCTGQVIAPGFIDLHSHSDLQVLSNHPEKSRQGVTTEVVGNCGFSAFPSGTHAGEVRKFANGIFCGGTDWQFESARDYLQAASRGSALVDVRSYAGHGSLRTALFGSSQRRLEAKELDLLAGSLADALAQGACGFSTGLMYAPGSAAGFEELAALCRVVAAADRLYATHMRSYSFGLLDAIEEQLQLARATGCRLQISHLQAVGRMNWDKQRRALELIEAAHRDGLDVEFDIYPYQAGSTVLAQFLPQHALDGGTERMIARFRDPEQRRRIAGEALEQLAHQWSDIVISAVGSDSNQPLVGKTIADVAAFRASEPIDVVMDLLVEEAGAVNIVSFNQSEENLRELLTHPLCSVISDGFYVKGRPHPRLFGTFPHLIGHVYRENRWMSLEEAVHKITAKPAARLGITDRGTLRPGARADVVVFDPQVIAGPANYESPELPPVGIRFVLRNGRLPA